MKIAEKTLRIISEFENKVLDSFSKNKNLLKRKPIEM